MQIQHFEEWTSRRSVASLGTNSGSESIAFQNWHKFKEAFPPELILEAVSSESRNIHAVIDPFGGSGTTALAAQFLGIDSTTFEINPFLVDVTKSKLGLHSAVDLTKDLCKVVDWSSQREIKSGKVFSNVPKTFIEPGHNHRWLFDSGVAIRLATILESVDRLPNPVHRRFFRVLLGGILVQVSNATINGKGRRYRRNWASTPVDPNDVDRIFILHCQDAIADVYKFSHRPRVTANVISGDARKLRTKRMHDLAILSPPYPNSFDYTDVYNIELWMLGYLTTGESNRALRNSTLTSHVQLCRKYVAAPVTSPTLNSALSELDLIRGDLWSRWIPEMVGAYFSDLIRVLRRVLSALENGSSCWIVVGDSRYGGIFIQTSQILSELVPSIGCRVEFDLPIRNMRSSSQHGGLNELSETLLILRKI